MPRYLWSFEELAMRCVFALGITATFLQVAADVSANESKVKLFPAGSVMGVVRDIGADGKSFKIEVGKPRVENGRIVVDKETVEVIFADDVKIRVPPPIERDDNGRPKPYRPDPSDKDYRRFPNTMPGTPGDILKGHIVKVDLGTTRPTGKELPRTLAMAIVVIGEEPR
jgi:hypothetical protein